MNTPTTLPPRFVDRMKRLLGPEFDAFLSTCAEVATAGVRFNTLKWSAEETVAGMPEDLLPVAWCPSGFRIDPGARTGKHPLHAAGLYYLQEPSAMAAAELLDVHPGQWVIDVAASPGGKSTHLASLLDNSGLLVANDPVRGRIKALGENLERWGARNAIITNSPIIDLATAMPGQFDRVLVDAPCSGEGMFRKSPAAIREWSEEHVRGCAIRQEQLLESASRLVKPGGLLLYCTCTFAPEENEMQIARFLERHDGWTLREIVLPAGSPGRSDWVSGDHASQLAKTRRLWPHLAEGEGHFFALLLAPNHQAESLERTPPHARKHTVSDRARALWDQFRQEALPGFETRGTLVQRGDLLFDVPAHPDSLYDLSVVRPGLPLGSMRPGRFEPSHALALAARTEDCAHTHELTTEEAVRYLQGETLRSIGPSGWLSATTEGFPLGWGKRSGDQLKNHYPRGLRQQVR